jgi:hypothetical protein
MLDKYPFLALLTKTMMSKIPPMTRSEMPGISSPLYVKTPPEISEMSEREKRAMNIETRLQNEFYFNYCIIKEASCRQKNEKTDYNNNESNLWEV